MELRDQTNSSTVSPVVQQAADNLGRARRHAITLERLAISILTFGIVIAALATAVAPALLWVSFAGALLAAVIWGTLRAQALQLHLLVDQTMVELDDASPAR